MKWKDELLIKPTMREIQIGIKDGKNSCWMDISFLRSMERADLRIHLTQSVTDLIHHYVNKVTKEEPEACNTPSAN